MSVPPAPSQVSHRRFTLSLDLWAVLLALVLALLVRVGIIQSVAW
jgi:hypothetical protein